jgi:hypothetical protein
MIVQTFNGFWTAGDCMQRPHVLFIFGDNNVGRGLKGQAVIRGCSNAMGIPTKKIPNYQLSSYYTDNEYDDNCTNISNACKKILQALDGGKYSTVIFPSDGLGTGLADLQKKAPRTNEFLKSEVKELIRWIGLK